MKREGGGVRFQFHRGANQRGRGENSRGKGDPDCVVVLQAMLTQIVLKWRWRWRLKQPLSLDDGGWSKMEKVEEKVWEGEKGERKCVWIFSPF